MTPQLDKTLRRGGMSRRGFLRAMGFTTAAVLVPGMGSGLIVPPSLTYKYWGISYNGSLILSAWFAERHKKGWRKTEPATLAEHGIIVPRDAEGIIFETLDGCQDGHEIVRCP